MTSNKTISWYKTRLNHQWGVTNWRKMRKRKDDRKYLNRIITIQKHNKYYSRSLANTQSLEKTKGTWRKGRGTPAVTTTEFFIPPPLPLPAISQRAQATSRKFAWKNPKYKKKINTVYSSKKETKTYTYREICKIKDARYGNWTMINLREVDLSGIGNFTCPWDLFLYGTSEG